MVSVAKIITLFVFICCLMNSDTCTVRNWGFPIKRTSIIVRPSYFTREGNKLSFAACDTGKHSEDTQCNVTMTNLDNSETKVCNNIKIEPEKKQYRIKLTNGIEDLIPLATDGVLLVEEVYDYLKIVIVNMVNCMNTELNFLLERDHYQEPIIVPGHNSFSAVINSRTTCVDVNRCTVTYNLNGQRISSPKTELAPITGKGTYITGSSNVPDAGYFLNVLESPGKMSVLHINPSGIATNLTVSKSSEYPIAFSNANKQYGICIQLPVDGSFRCMQFDEKAKLKLDVTVVVTEISDYIMGPAAVYNLVDDGLLLASLTCPLVSIGIDDCRYSVWRIHANGQLVRQNEVKDQNKTCYRDGKDINVMMDARINENEKGELCFDFSCYSRPRNSNDDKIFEIFRNCKPKAEILLQQGVRRAS